MYLPLYNAAEKKYFIKIESSKLCGFTVSLPLCAFLGCVIITMYKDFESANRTHCNVPNVFPSISAAIGSYEPQSTIWRTALYVHAPFRFFIIYLRFKHYRSIIIEELRAMVDFTVFLNVIENLALLGLTHWTSALHYPYHELCFKMFIGTSIFYMLFVCILLSRCRRRPTVTTVEKKSLRMKWRAFIVNSISFGLAAYFFLRHNRVCEPYVYSMFGFSEYIVVVSNIGFHMTTVYDLPRQTILITKSGIHTID